MRRRSISLTAGRSAMRTKDKLSSRCGTPTRSAIGVFSVTAWYGDEMVGHALFSPVRLRLMGETVRVLAVLPNFQRQGIGGQLLGYGHDLGRR